MPPRAKKTVASKKPSPKPKPEPEVLPSKAVVENKVSEPKEVTIPAEDVTVMEEVVVEMSSVTTTTVVEETKVMEVVEETKVMEVVEEKGEVGASNGDLDTKMDGSDKEEDPEELVEEEEVQMDEQQGATQDLVEEKIADGDVEEEDSDEDGEGDEEGTTGVDEGGIKEHEDDKGESGDEDNEDPSTYMQASLDKKKDKEFELFVGGLDKEAVEDDLIKVFGEFGEIKSARIMKHPNTQKSRGFAFIKYANIEHAKKVLAEWKDGTEIKGKRVRISASQDSETLYVGHICKTWTQEQVLETLKKYGIEPLEIDLPKDPENEGQNKGFIHLEFSSHLEAMTAFRRLAKRDAIFGFDRSARVSFAQTSVHPGEEALSQVRTVFIEGMTESWDEEKVKEFCKQYGEVEKVELSRNLFTTKRDDFGFVLFTSRESALACVEGINSAQVGEEDSKLKASLAKPRNRGRLGGKPARGGYNGYKVTRGGFKVNKDSAEEAGSSKKNDNAKSKEAKGKRKVPPKSRSAKGKPSKPQQDVSQRDGAGREKRERPERSRKRGTRSKDSGQPSKKPRGDRHDSNQRNKSHIGKPRQSYGMGPSTYAGPYYQGYAAPAPIYPVPVYGAHSVSNSRYSDMEPHGGYLQPGQNQYKYGQRRGGGYEGQGSSGAPYGGGSGRPPLYLAGGYSSYPGYELQSGGHGGYGYPTSSAYPPRQTFY